MIVFFYTRKQLLLQRILAITVLSVCLSVRLFVSQKRCKLGLPNLHRRVPGRLWFQEP